MLLRFPFLLICVVTLFRRVLQLVHFVRLLVGLQSDRVERPLWIHIVAETLGKVATIPHHQLLIWHYVSSRIKVNVVLVLARHQIHDAQIECGRHITHPVRLLNVRAIQIIVVVIFEYLHRNGSQYKINTFSKRKCDALLVITQAGYLYVAICNVCGALNLCINPRTSYRDHISSSRMCRGLLSMKRKFRKITIIRTQSIIVIRF